MSIPERDELDLLHKNICQALGSPIRIQILYALHEAPMNVGALASLLGLPQATTSRHLAVLRQTGMVETTRDGSSVTYRVAEMRLIQILDTMRSMLRDLLARQASLLPAPEPTV
jgi:ArsR family transcriptional regulator